MRLHPFVKLKNDMFSTSIGSWTRERRRKILRNAGLALVLDCLVFILDVLFASNPRHRCGESPRSGGRIFQCSTRESGLHLFRGRKQK